MSSAVYGINNSKKRQRLEMICSILEAAGSGEKITKVCYKSYVTTNIELRGYLDELVHTGLLEYNQETRIYKCSDKGARYLEIYYRMRDVVK